MRKIEPGTIVRLRRNTKLIGTVIKVDKGHLYKKYSILWFGHSRMNHNFSRNEIQVVSRSNTADL